MKLLILMMSLFVASQSNAGLLDVQLGTQKIGGVVIAETAVLPLDGQTVQLTTVSAGLRKKYVVLGIGTSVYVAQIMVAKPELYTKSLEGSVTLDSLAQQNVIAVKLDFIYNVSADKLYNAFSEALTANQVDVNASDIAGFLANIENGSDAANGKSITLVFSKNSDGTEKVMYEDSQLAVTEVVGAAGLSQKIMSMWLGQISGSDKGLLELKQQLLK